MPAALPGRRVILLLLLLAAPAMAEPPKKVDVVVYGATPGGISAAIGAAREGTSVLLIEPTSRIGGLTASGLSHTDFHSFESLTGAFLEFSQRIEAWYAADAIHRGQQPPDTFRGTFAEPKVNLAVFHAMLADHDRITLLKEATLVRPEVENGTRITAVVIRHAGADHTVAARMFIDGTYEGDLLAAAGVPWKAGREGRDEFGESLAPEKADGELQAYNFRFIMTPDPDNRIMPVAPPGYRREDFVGILPILASGKIKKVFDYPSNCLFKAQTPPLPNNKYDINDVSRGLVRLSLPGKNLGWPDGDAETRAAIFAEHRRDQVGLLYFLQNDPEVPAKFQQEAREWGWCKDEFTETAGLPPQLYVREARRMQGLHIYSQPDSEHVPGDARAVLHKNAIAMGDYGNNCHGTHHEGPRFGGSHSGEFYNPVPPYQIPYGVLVPKTMTNLLSPVAVSSTHVGFCALRLEPIWMSLGQAAGHAAGMAIRASVPVQKVDVPRLQAALHQQGSATIYVTDVLPDHPLFAAVQWWGTAGGLHGLEPMPAKPGQRGKKRHGQYSEAVPGHEVQLDKPLDESLATKWKSLATELGLAAESLPAADGKTTRGQFIEAAYRLKKAQ